MERHSEDKTFVPCSTRCGQILVGIALLCLSVGGATVRIFFPERLGAGLDQVALTILIPIWSIGIVGLVLISWGWIQNPARDTQLFFHDLERRPDGRLFSPLTRSLAALTCGLIVLVSLACLVLLPPEEASAFANGFVFFCVTSPCGFTLYLLYGYQSERDRAVTTYLNDFMFLFAFLLVGFFWPLVLLFNFQVRRQRWK